MKNSSTENAKGSSRSRKYEMLPIKMTKTDEGISCASNPNCLAPFDFGGSPNTFPCHHFYLHLWGYDPARTQFSNWTIMNSKYMEKAIYSSF